jgi:hypothetical protein
VDKGPLIVVRNRGTGEVVGYMSSARGTHLTELDPEDPDFFGDEQETAQYCTDDTLYVWNVSIVPRHRNQSVFSTLLYPSTIQEAARNGYRKIVFHSRQSENLTPMYEQKYGARRIRQVDDWFPTLPEEKFDLVEIDLDPATNPRIEETLLLSLKNPTRAERERHELDRRLNGLQENYARKRSEGRGKGGVPRHPDEIAIDVARLMIRAQSAGVDIAPFQDRWRRMEPEIRARYETWQSTGERTDGPIQLAT